jgi:hypothetical protein
VYVEIHQKAANNYCIRKGDEVKAANLQVVINYQNREGDDYRHKHLISATKYTESKKFPPAPLTCVMQLKIMTKACKAMTPSIIAESDCAVSGILTPNTKLSDLESMSSKLYLLERSEVTRKERHKTSDKMTGMSGPVLINELNKICNTCARSLKADKVPKKSLANGLWIGSIPSELKDLSYAEHMLIARI